jgi:acyl-coenzyme A thioesterase PaaI-like protein
MALAALSRTTLRRCATPRLARSLRQLSPPMVDESSFARPVRRVRDFPWVSEVGTEVSHQFPHANPHLRLAYFLEREEHGAGLGFRLHGRVWLGEGAEGPPNHGHGGAQAAILDEAMGGCAWLNNYKVLAGEISIRFIRPVPLGIDAHISAEIERVEGRKVSLRGRLTAAPGAGTAGVEEPTVYATSTGTFVQVDPSRMLGALADARSGSARGGIQGS